VKAIYEVVKIFDVEPFHADSGDAFRFRLEVLHELNTNLFEGKVYRLETYRLQPTFPQSEGELPNWRNDGLIHVVDDMLNAAPLSGNSIEEVLENFKKAFSSIFGLS
jgi:hypothetical protein